MARRRQRRVTRNASVEPLFDWGGIVDAGDVDDEIYSLLEEEGPPSEDDGDVYHGRRVRWLGHEGRMLRASWDQVHPVAGNIFDPDKAATFVAYSKAQEDTPIWHAPAAWVGSPVDLQDVEESQQAELRHELFESYGMTRPYTTGDEELDEYLRDRGDLRQQLRRLSESGDDDEAEELAEQIAEMEDRAVEALRRQSGDLGTVVVQLRDGNHRAAAAYALGEPALWVYVTRDHEGALADELE